MATPSAVPAVRAALLVALAIGAAPSHAAAPPSGEAAPLILERSIPLEHVGGRIDHMAVDLGRQRLLVAELGNGTVDIVDLPAGRSLHRITGLSSPQGVGYVPAADRIVV